MERYSAAVEAAMDATEMEERVEAQFGEVAAVEVEDPEVTQGCECAMMHIFPPCPFETGKMRILSCQGKSSPQYRVTFFARTSTYVDCVGRTASIKTRTFPPPQKCRQPLPDC